MSEFKQFEQPSFTTNYLGDGVQYRLPRRQLGRARHLGWIVFGAGLILSLFMLGWMSGPILMGVKEFQIGNAGGWFSIAFGCFGLIGLIPGLGMLQGGLAIVSNRTRCEVELRDGQVFVKERFYFARMRRKRDIAGIRELQVSDGSEHLSAIHGPRSQKHNTAIWLGDSDHALVAKTNHKKTFLLAAAYPHDLLMRLAEELAPRLEAELSRPVAKFDRDPKEIIERDGTPQKISITEASIDTKEPISVPERPAGSTTTIERRDYGITIEIPPAGLWKGSKGLFFFALIWNAFISIFFVVGTLGAIGVIEMQGDGPPWLMLLIMIPFLGVGISLLVAAVNMGRRRATIATADDLVMIVRHSIFGKTTREWSAVDIEAIRCGNSGMEVNDIPVKELQIIPVGEKKFGCLSQLEDDELQWIAAELNHSLGIDPRSTRDEHQLAEVQRDASGSVTARPGGRISLERTIDGLRIDIPPVGLLKYAGLVIFGFVFVAIGTGIGIGVNWDAFEQGIERLRLSELLFAAAFLLGFGGVGVAVMCSGLVAGRRRFQLQVTHDELILVRRGPFLSKTFRWHRDELDSIAVKDSGTQVNNQSLYQVYIHSEIGDSVGIMTGQDRADLAIVSAALNDALDIVPPTA